MRDTLPFGWLVLLVAVVGLVAVLSNHLTNYLKIPTPGLFLVAAAIGVKVVPDLHPLPEQTVIRLVTVALLVILFDGGMSIGWRRFDAAKGPIIMLGVVGTFLTVAGAAVVAHLAVGLGWYLSLLVATAVAPTDPAVVFSVLGQREVAGRSGLILEGESGANDPVGIALMASLIAAGGISAGAAAHAAGEFALQMLVGIVVGVLGGKGVLWFMRKVPLPGEGLYPLRTLACAFALYGVATVAHGSGFLAVFVAGVLVGDGKAPYKTEVRRFHSALASLAEIVAFLALGLTVDLSMLARLDVWLPGLVIALALAVVVRPLFAGLCLLPAHLRRNETAFVLFAGLKGAVPLLLGSYLLATDLPSAPRLYGIVVVVVAISVAIQGSLVPAAARILHLRMRSVEQHPWALGVRLIHEPVGVHQLTIRPGSAADGSSVADVIDTHLDAWVSLVVRDRQMLGVSGETTLRAGDQVMVLAPPERARELVETFEVAE